MQLLYVNTSDIIFHQGNLLRIFFFLNPLFISYNTATLMHRLSSNMHMRKRLKIENPEKKCMFYADYYVSSYFIACFVNIIKYLLFGNSKE